MLYQKNCAVSKILIYLLNIIFFSAHGRSSTRLVNYCALKRRLQIIRRIEFDLNMSLSLKAAEVLQFTNQFPINDLSFLLSVEFGF